MRRPPTPPPETTIGRRTPKQTASFSTDHHRTTDIGRGKRRPRRTRRSRSTPEAGRVATFRHRVATSQLILPSWILRNTSVAVKRAESMIPATVNVPPTMAHTCSGKRDLQWGAGVCLVAPGRAHGGGGWAVAHGCWTQGDAKYIYYIDILTNKI